MCIISEGGKFAFHLHGNFPFPVSQSLMTNKMTSEQKNSMK